MEKTNKTTEYSMGEIMRVAHATWALNREWHRVLLLVLPCLQASRWLQNLDTYIQYYIHRDLRGFLLIPKPPSTEM